MSGCLVAAFHKRVAIPVPKPKLMNLPGGPLRVDGWSGSDYRVIASTGKEMRRARDPRSAKPLLWIFEPVPQLSRRRELLTLPRFVHRPDECARLELQALDQVIGHLQQGPI